MRVIIRIFRFLGPVSGGTTPSEHGLVTEYRCGRHGQDVKSKRCEHYTARVCKYDHARASCLHIARCARSLTG